MSGLLADPAALRERIRGWNELKQAGRLDAVQREALAEAYFRLAVHRETLTEQKIRLLLQAIQLDGGNPKLAYHLALVYLRAGELERGGAWLQTAHRLSPTSHRIWAHVSLTQRALQQQYRGSTQYDQQALRDRSDRIASAIQQGDDAIDQTLLNLKPPRIQAANAEAPRRDRPAESLLPEPDAAAAAVEEYGAAMEIPPRLVNAGRCRWSGVHDLLIEDLFERIPTSSVRDRILTLMEPIARGAAQRRAGHSSFVVLAIEWLVRGYPIPAVRRLLAEVEATPTPAAAQLLELVCTLCEAPTADLTALLSQAVSENRLPPTLAALIHERRLLRHRLELPTLAQAIRAAWDFVDHARTMPPPDAEGRRALLAKAREHSQAVEQALHDLQMRPEVTVADAAPRIAARALDPAEVAARLDALEAGVERLDALRLEGFEVLRAEIVPRATQDANAEALAQIRADRAGVDTLLAELRRAAGVVDEQAQQIDDAVQKLGPEGAPERFGERRERVLRLAQGLLNQGNFARALNRLDRTLPVGDVGAAALPPLSERLAGLVAVAGEAVCEIEQAIQAGDGTGEPGGAAEATPAEQLRALLATLDEARSGLDDAWTRLGELRRARSERPLDDAEQAAGHAVADLVRVTFPRVEACLAELSGLRASGAVEPADLGQLDAGEERARAVLAQQGRFGRGLRTLDLSAAAVAAPASLSSGPAEATIAQDGGTPPAAAPAAPPTPAPRPPANTVFALAAQLAQVDQRVDALFTEANQSFDAYARTALQAAPLRRLRASVRARQAECLYRCGRRTDARQIWSDLLREDGLNARLLQNLATAQTVEGSANQGLLSWRTYVELLYFNASLAGTPRAGAQARATFHREFGAAYAPHFLSAGGDARQRLVVDEAALLGFLSNPGRVQHFIGHTLLSFFNQRLDFSSPPLALGVDRTEGRAVRQRARAAQHEFADLCRPLLPDRVQRSFHALAVEHVNAAAEACEEARRTIGRADPGYHDQEKRHRDWILAIIDVKFRIFECFMVLGDQGTRPRISVISQLDSLDFLDDLLLLDRLPIDASTPLYEAVARSRLPNTDLFLDMMDLTRRQIVMTLLNIIFQGYGNATDAERTRLYRRMVQEWVHRPALAGEVEVIDSPGNMQGVYSEQIRAALQGQTEEPNARRAAADELRALISKYPQSSGPARHLAMVLIMEQKFDEALTMVERASKDACSDVGRTACQRLAIETRIARLMNRLQQGERITEAEVATDLTVLLDALADDAGDASLPHLTIQAFVALAGATRRNDRHAELHRVVTAWTDRASARPAGGEESAEAADERRAGVRRIRNELPDGMLNYLVTAAGGLSDANADWEAILTAAGIARGYFPDFTTAIFIEMMAQFNLGGKQHQAGQRAAARVLLQAAHANAQELLQASADAEHRKAAQQVLTQTTTFLQMPG